MPAPGKCAAIGEQQWSELLLSAEDVDILRKLDFEIAPSSVSRSAESDKKGFVVNPKQYVGHFLLPSGQTVVIRPKIEAANVFRMLAYVYTRQQPDSFLDADVLYESDQFLFEPLVELFNGLVSKRVRRGLYQSYLEHEDNLAVFRGRLSTSQHLQFNLGRPDRVFCRYSQQTHDIEDNQIIKWTLAFLLGVFPWSRRTLDSLRANFHQFEAVSLVRPVRTAFQKRHYHRLNEDYELLHALCRLFLDKKSISEKSGAIGFRGFLLDMNVLFEQFVSTAFQVAGQRARILVVSQESAFLSLYPVRIRPDITIRSGREVLAVVDAKYKRSLTTYENADINQMLAYGTALKCARTYLIFPVVECDREEVVELLNTDVTIEVRRLDLGDKNCVNLAEELGKTVLNEVSQ